MPLSFGLVTGLLAVVIGAILSVATRQKKAARVMIGIGVAMTLLTLAALVLAVNSRM